MRKERLAGGWLQIALFAVIFVAVIGPDLAPIKDFLWAHPWWRGTLIALPALLLALLGLRHSSEANRLRHENIRLDAERNSAMREIAKNVVARPTPAEQNARTLRKYLGKAVAVTENGNTWGTPAPQIVDVNDANILTLFRPYTSAGHAWMQQVNCADLQITELPQGSCALRLHVLKRHGHPVQLGEIEAWEDRDRGFAVPAFSKGTIACSAGFTKPGSTEGRVLSVYAASDGTNSFLLESSSGDRIVGSGKDVSVRFMALQVEYEAAGFRRTTFSSTPGPHTLFVR